MDGEFQRLTAFLREQSARRANLPVFLYGERRTIEKVPSKLLKYIHGFIFLFEDTKSFISRQVMRAAEDYMKNLLPPFFKALIHHAAESNYLLAYAGPCRRRGVHQVAGRPRLPPVLR